MGRKTQNHLPRPELKACHDLFLFSLWWVMWKNLINAKPERARINLALGGHIASS